MSPSTDSSSEEDSLDDEEVVDQLGDVRTGYSGSSLWFVHGSDRFLLSSNSPSSVTCDSDTGECGGLGEDVDVLVGLALEHHPSTSTSPLLRLRAMIGIRSSSVGSGGGGDCDSDVQNISSSCSVCVPVEEFFTKGSASEAAPSSYYYLGGCFFSSGPSSAFPWIRLWGGADFYSSVQPALPVPPLR